MFLKWTRTTGGWLSFQKNLSFLCFKSMVVGVGCTPKIYLGETCVPILLHDYFDCRKISITNIFSMGLFVNETTEHQNSYDDAIVIAFSPVVASLILHVVVRESHI